MTGQLKDFSLRSVQGQYFWNLEETQAAGWLGMLANVYTTDQPHEIHKWLGGAPSMQKFRGERVRRKLSDYGLTVISDKFTATLPFDIDDFRRDKTGQPMRRVREMGQKAGTLGQRLFTTLLEGGAAAGTAYDGSAFFANSHNVGTVDNLFDPSATTPAAPTSTELSDAMLSAIGEMQGYKDETGDPANEFARQFMVMVPNNMFKPLAGAMKDLFHSSGSSNTLKAVEEMGYSIVPVVNPRLTDTSSIYVARTDGPIKAGIWQEEEIGREAFKTLGADSDNAFWREEIVFGAKRIAQSALGRFELLSKSTFV